MEIKHFNLQASREHPVGALDLARWGFYLTHEVKHGVTQEVIRCQFCELYLSGSEQREAIVSMHMQCPLILGYIVSNVKIGEEGDLMR